MAKEQEQQPSLKRGSVWSFTVVHEPPSGFVDVAPYVTAIIESDEGSFVTAQLTDLDWSWYIRIDEDGIERPTKRYHIEIGMPVEMVTRKLHSKTGERGMLVYGYKFRPILERSTEQK